MSLSVRRSAALFVAAIAVAGCGTSTPAATGPRDAEAATVLSAFAEQSGNPGRSFHLVQEGSVSVGGRSVELRYELDAAGQNIRGVIKLGAETIELVVKDAVTYAKVGGAWSTLPSDADLTRDILDVFRYVGDPGNLSFTGRLEEPGMPVYTFRANNPVPYQTAQMRELGISGSIVELYFHVRGDGIPVSISFVSTAEQGNTKVDGRSTIQFSRWGEPIVIEAPY